uniref:BCL2 antagonist/killer 1 n=1 Tax=Sus scrofa TaxID=9823 RepID=A0A8D1CK62_PIG
MASGQGPGPPRQGCGEPDPSSTSEEQVARDTEEVFRSYVFHRHQQEQEAEGAAAPTDPEMVTLPLEPSSTMGQVGRQLAIIGDDINRRYDSEFQAMLQHLQPTAENAYEYFTKIASRPQQRPQPVREWHQLGPSGGSSGLWLPPGPVRLPEGPDRLPRPGDPLCGRLHAASLHRPVDCAEGWLGECLGVEATPAPVPAPPCCPPPSDHSISPGRWQPWIWETAPSGTCC